MGQVVRHRSLIYRKHTAAMALVQGRIPTTLSMARVSVIDCWVSADLRLARLYLQIPPEAETGMSQAEFFATANAQLSKPLRKYFATHLATKFIPDPSFWPMEEDLPPLPNPQ